MRLLKHDELNHLGKVQINDTPENGLLGETPLTHQNKDTLTITNYTTLFLFRNLLK